MSGARVTRSAAASQRPASAAPTTLLVNPTVQKNWPPEPSTPEEFQAWLTQTKAALLKWLTEAQAQAQDIPIANAIHAYTASADARWAPYELRTDVETGQIYDPTQRSAMKTAVEEETKRRVDLHQQHETWRKFVEYKYAQAAWEDFLYYQNVWNRRNCEPGRLYAETKSEKAKMRRAKLRQAMEQEGEDSESDEDVVAKAPAPSKKPGREKVLERGTANQEKMDRTDTKWCEEPFFTNYSDWMYHMIGLYRDAKLGYRKRITAVVAPEDVHRYTQPPRGTTPQALLRYQKRHRHLEERFPRRKRRQININEVEEDYRTRTERKQDRWLEANGVMMPISWRIDGDAYEKMRAKKEADSGFSKNPRTLKLLPKGHKTHHGSRETSFNWPTSFDSPAWGNNIAVTAVQRGYAYEEVSDPEADPVEPRKKKRKDRSYKVDENGKPVKKVDERPRYKREEYSYEGRAFVHDPLGDGVAGRDQNGRWIGDFVQEIISQERWELDEDRDRVPLAPQDVLKNTFTTFNMARPNMKDTRPQKHVNARTTDQISDDEDAGCVDSNENFPRSGNMNQDQLGDPWASSDETDGEEGADHPGDSEDDESDDDGDLFAQSYKECSSDEYAERRRASLLLESLQARFGIIQGVGIEQILDMQRNEEGFDDYSEEEIEAEYRRRVVRMRGEGM
jgi:hypothetical protein